MTYTYWFLAGLVAGVALSVWWFRGDLKYQVEDWRERAADRIRRWLA